MERYSHQNYHEKYIPEHIKPLVLRLMLILLMGYASIVLSLVSAQVPQGFNYQAVARDETGQPIINTMIPIRLTIQSDTLGGTLFWQELHSTVTTNDLGIFALVVGKGARQSGSAAKFDDIDWTVTPKFIMTEVDYNGWKNMGSSRLWAVPYSMVARNLAGSVNKLTVEGQGASMEEPLFEVKNKSGQTVFAVYNEGVRIYVDDGNAKGVKGGFAIGGLDPAKGPGDLFIVNADSIRAYIDTNPAKGVKGGFAIGGIEPAKAGSEEYLRVTRDSTRIYIANPAKGVKGGFAIGGFDNAKGTVYDFMDLTPDNYFIGHESGQSIRDGLYNSFIGYQSGRFTTDGTRNSFFGYRSGYSNTIGSKNLFLGDSSGFSNVTGDYNTFVGVMTGKSNTSGESNTFIGSYAGESNTSGSNNAFVGYRSGYNNTVGNGNSYIGNYAGFYNTTGNYNSFLGYKSGFYTNADYNVFLGYYSGFNNMAGSYNFFAGYQAGYLNTTGSNNVFLGHQSGYSNISPSYNVFIGDYSGYYNSISGVTGTQGAYNIFVGYRAGYNNRTGESNVFIGHESGESNTSGTINTYIGYSTGQANTSGSSNVFIGNNAGLKNQLSSNNVFIGTRAGQEHITSNENVFIGYDAGKNHTEGEHNVFLGPRAGIDAEGSGNIAIGWRAGEGNTSGSSNVFVSTLSGYKNTTGSRNVMIGDQAGINNQTGNENVIIGRESGLSLSSGSRNIIIGYQSGLGENGSDRLHIGQGSLIYGEMDNDLVRINGQFQVQSGSSNITALRMINTTVTPIYLLQVLGSGNGARAGNFELWRTNDGDLNCFSVNNDGYMGLGVTVPEARLDILGGTWNPTTTEGDVRIGNSTYKLKIGVAINGGGAGDVRLRAQGGTNRIILGGGDQDIMFVNDVNVMPYTDNFSNLGGSTNRWKTVYAVNGTINTSDARLKTNINPIEYGLESILRLNPVSFAWKDDSEQVEHLGLVAQDVEDVISEVVDKGSDPYQTLGINYSGLIPVLIKGIQEQQQIIESQKSEIDELRNRIGQIEQMMIAPGSK